MRSSAHSPTTSSAAHPPTRVPWFDGALFSERRISGLTHEMYRYPARFSPEFVRAALTAFSKPGDYVLDPFIGGGTTAVEALAWGRRIVGFDVNELSLILTRAKTTPLSARHRSLLRDWLEPTTRHAHEAIADPRLANAPSDLVTAFSPAVLAMRELPDPARDAARAILLQVGQWAVDGRETPVEPGMVAGALAHALDALLFGLDELVATARTHGQAPSAFRRRRILRLEPALVAASGRPLARLRGRINLVVTSPPYPGVHVLYHRWQVRGRVETPFPYWLADARDGSGPKFYTMGGRSRVGIDRYFREMLQTWKRLRGFITPGATVVQLVAFADPEEQYPRYLALMEQAGYRFCPDLSAEAPRQVPNRKWYYRTRPDRGHSGETLLVHSA